MLRSVFRIPSRSLYSKVPKTFYNVPYNEQYEQRDFVWEKTISKQYKDIRIPSLKDLVNLLVIVSRFNYYDSLIYLD